jgi:hypothetical protein
LQASRRSSIDSGTSDCIGRLAEIEAWRRFPNGRDGPAPLARFKVVTEEVVADQYCDLRELEEAT